MENHPGRGISIVRVRTGRSVRLVETDQFFVGIRDPNCLAGVGSDKGFFRFQLLVCRFYMCRVESVVDIMVWRSRSKIGNCVAAVCVAVVSLTVCRRRRGGASSSLAF